MTPIRAILAATDFSADAHNACRRAAHLAAEHGAQLQLLHVLRTDVLDPLREKLGGAELRQEILDDATRRLDALADEFVTATRARPRPLMRAGKVLEEILAAADHADVLVLGAHGLGALRELVLGSMAERMLRMSRRPMLVVRSNPDVRYEKVFVPVDFSLHAMTALRFARRIAPAAQLHVFHAYDNPYEDTLVRSDVGLQTLERFRAEAGAQAAANMENLIAKAGLSGDTAVTSSIRRGAARTIIAEAATTQNADLLVIGKHGRTPTAEFFLGGVTRATLSLVKCDVAIVRDYPRI